MAAPVRGGLFHACTSSNGVRAFVFKEIHMTEGKPRCASLEVFLQTQRKEGPAERNRNLEIMRGVYGKARKNE